MGAKTLPLTYAEPIQPTPPQQRALRTFFKGTGALAVHVLGLLEAPARRILVLAREDHSDGPPLFSLQTIGRAGKTLAPEKTPNFPPRQVMVSEARAVEAFEKASYQARCRAGQPVDEATTNHPSGEATRPPIDRALLREYLIAKGQALKARRLREGVLP
ncbi:hypothetical protein D3C86_1568780 [compost metagenome]